MNRSILIFISLLIPSFILGCTPDLVDQTPLATQIMDPETHGTDPSPGKSTPSTTSLQSTPTKVEPTKPQEVPLQELPTIEWMLFEDLILIPGQVVTLSGIDINITLIEAHGPPDDCADCPVTATLIVRSPEETMELGYSFSGNMTSDALERARRGEAFGYTFIAVRVDEGSFTLRVEPTQ